MRQNNISFTDSIPDICSECIELYLLTVNRNCNRHRPANNNFAPRKNFCVGSWKNIVFFGKPNVFFGEKFRNSFLIGISLKNQSIVGNFNRESLVLVKTSLSERPKK